MIMCSRESPKNVLELKQKMKMYEKEKWLFHLKGTINGVNLVFWVLGT